MQENKMKLNRSIDIIFSYQENLEDGKAKKQCGRLKSVTVAIFFSNGVFWSWRCKRKIIGVIHISL